MSSLIRELDPLQSVPPRPYTPPPIMTPKPIDPPPLKGDALKRRQLACIAWLTFETDSNGERYYTDEYVRAVCMVDNPPIFHAPIG